MVSGPRALPLATSRRRAAPDPLLPRRAALLYLLSPPFLALLLEPGPLVGDFAGFGPHLFAIWAHALAIGGIVHALYTWVVPRLLRDACSLPAKIGIHVAAVGVSIGGGLALTQAPIEAVCAGDSPGLVVELYTATLVTAVLVTFAASYESLRRRARDIELRAQRADRAALRAQLSSLQARTNPHFLFNSLNTVAGLIRQDPRLAEQTVERLADVFRYSLEASGHTRVPLARELDIARDYLEVEGIRFGERLSWSLEVEPDAAAVLVPPLLIQPLVENAVHHGVAQRRGAGGVALRGRVAGEQLIVTIDDDGPGPGRSRHRGSRTSLRDLRERLQLACGPQAALELRARTEGGSRAQLTIPLRSPEP